MKNICLVAYYDLKEALYEAKISLEKNGYNVIGFPLYKLMYDIYDKQENYTDIFVDYIINNKIDVVFWWFINIDSEKFKYIKEKTNVKYIFFNWDEPFNWELCDIKNKAKYIDCAFITCKESVNNYTSNGCQLVYNLPPAFSPTINFPIDIFDVNDYNKYYCDISFCCTNLYDTEEYNRQYIKRKKIIDDIYENQFKKRYKFHIYGPEKFKEMYPESYKGFITYDKLNYLFNYSKINLCTHVICDADGYINERVILIGGSGGLLFVDNVKGINEYFKSNEEIIIIDKEKYVDQITNILDDYNYYVDIKKNFYHKCLYYYTYDAWAQFINEKFLKTIHS